MTYAITCECSEHLVFKARIEGRNFLRCSACNSLTPMPQRGARLLNEARFLESLKQHEPGAPPDDRYPPIVGVLITLSVFALTVYVGWHVCVWMGRA